MSKFKDFVIRYTDKDLDEFLMSKGYFQIKRGVFENMDGSNKIEIKDNEIKCISAELSSVYGEERVELFVSFIPEIPVLEHLLRGIYFIR